jgi:hypothetical protein
LSVAGFPNRPDRQNPNFNLRVTRCRPGRGVFTMLHLLACNVACLAIAALYYSWRDVYARKQKRAVLQERVAYMLWVAAARA